jgi:putative tricarboxylic transport membrane protein
MQLFGFSPAATVLGMVLGVLTESELRRSLIISHGSWSIFLTRPIAATLVVLTIGVLIYPAVLNATRLWGARRAATGAVGSAAKNQKQ